MNELLNSLISGFWHIFSQKSFYHLFFVLLLLIQIDIKKWQRIVVLTGLFTLGFYLSILLQIYHVVNINHYYIKLFTLISLLVITLFNYFDSSFSLNNIRNFIGFIAGVIHGLNPLRSLSTSIHKFSIKFISAIFGSIGIWGGLMVFILICTLILMLIQFMSKVSKQNTASVFNTMALIYITYLLLVFYGIV